MLSTAPPRRCGRACRVLGAAALAGTAPICVAQHSIAIQGGSRTDLDTVGLQLTLPAWFRSEAHRWRISGAPELQVNRHERDGDVLYQGGAFATFRFESPPKRVRPYLELGVGINLFSRDTLGSKEFSTRFQFGEFVGVGIAWGGETPSGRGESWFGIRMMHFSNAGLRQPNRGLEVVQLTLGHRF